MKAVTSDYSNKETNTKTFSNNMFPLHMVCEQLCFSSVIMHTFNCFYTLHLTVLNTSACNPGEINQDYENMTAETNDVSITTNGWQSE